MLMACSALCQGKLANSPASKVQAWHTSQAGSPYSVLIPPKGIFLKWMEGETPKALTR